MGSEVTAIDLDESMHQLSRGSGNDGSSDPLLQIPTQLSAVLTMKRGSPQHRRSQSKQINTTSPLLKRKRESIVWSWEKNYKKDFLYNFYHMAVKKQNKIDTWKYTYHLIFVISIFYEITPEARIFHWNEWSMLASYWKGCVNIGNMFRCWSMVFSACSGMRDFLSRAEDRVCVNHEFHPQKFLLGISLYFLIATKVSKISWVFCCLPDVYR